MKYFRIDIQLHTICNRKCDWCIFGHYNIPKKFMDDKTFNNTLDYIEKHIEYFETPLWFVLHKFFEPLLYPDILLKRTKAIKERFPNSSIKINSNCDNLNENTIYALKYVDKLSIPNYANISNLNKIFKVKTINLTENLIVGYINNTETIIHTNEIPILSRGSVLYNKTKNNYGFYEKENKDICCIYGQYFSVAYDGSIMPCYDTVPYLDLHKNIILGNVSDQNYKINLKYDFSNKECCKYCNVNYDNCSCVYNK